VDRKVLSLGFQRVHFEKFIYLLNS